MHAVVKSCLGMFFYSCCVFGFELERGSLTGRQEMFHSDFPSGCSDIQLCSTHNIHTTSIIHYIPEHWVGAHVRIQLIAHLYIWLSAQV